MELYFLFKSIKSLEVPLKKQTPPIFKLSILLVMSLMFEFLMFASEPIIINCPIFSSIDIELSLLFTKASWLESLAGLGFLPVAETHEKSKILKEKETIIKLYFILISWLAILFIIVQR